MRDLTGEDPTFFSTEIPNFTPSSPLFIKAVE